MLGEDPEFDALAERVMHSLLLSPRPLASTESAPEKAVRIAEELRDALRERALENHLFDGLNAKESFALQTHQTIEPCASMLRSRTQTTYEDALHQVRKHAEVLGIELFGERID